MKHDDETKSEWMGEPKWVLEQIMVEMGNDPVDAEVIRRELAELHPDLRSILIEWWKSGRVDMDREWCGWSIRMLLERRRCRHVLAALTWIDGLLRNPAETEMMLNERRSEIRFDPAKRLDAIKKASH